MDFMTPLKLLNVQFEQQIYACLTTLFNYKPNMFIEFNYNHIKMIAAMLNISGNTLIELMYSFDWCYIKKKKLFFSKKYYIYIYL